MNEAENPDRGIQLTLSVWHPGCWTLQVTEEVDAGLLAHGVYSMEDERVKGMFTAYGDSVDEVDAIVEKARSSRLTESVIELRERHGTRSRSSIPENSTLELFVEYESDNVITDALLDRGFINEEPIRIRHGREYWPVFFPGPRDEAEAHLEELRESADADIEVTRITSAGGRSRDLRHLDCLSDSQREAFELARERGYYTWPRSTSTRELAAELDVSKTTLLNHLRKAEAKLLDPNTV